MNGKKLAVFTASLIISFVLLDRVGAYVLDEYNKKLKHGPEYFTQKALTDETCEVLFIGASQCEGNYNTSIIEENLGMDVFNGGMAGQHADYQVQIANVFINRKVPKVIVWDFDPKLFSDDNHVWLKSGLRPYYYYSDQITVTLDRVDPMMKYKQVISSYKYNSLPIEYFFYSRGKADTNQGYIPYKCRDLKSMEVVMEDTYPPKGEDFERKKKLINDALIQWKKNGIKVIVVISPMHKRIDYPIWGVELMQKICKQERIDFYDFSELEGVYTEKELFRDHIHLCQEGSEIYSNYISEVIHKLLSGNNP